MLTVKRRRSTQLERTAYHEAGHAVAAARLRVGIDFEGVTIRPGPDFHGRAVTANGLRWAPEYDGAVVLLAGEAAQNVFAPRSCSQYRDSFKDNMALMDWLRHHGHNSVEQQGKLERKYKRAAYAFVREHWADVERVALALLERETLCGPDIRGIIARSEVRSKKTAFTA
jgi:hypothetical protein